MPGLCIVIETVSVNTTIIQLNSVCLVFSYVHCLNSLYARDSIVYTMKKSSRQHWRGKNAWISFFLFFSIYLKSAWNFTLVCIVAWQFQLISCRPPISLYFIFNVLFHIWSFCDVYISYRKTRLHSLTVPAHHYTKFHDCNTRMLCLEQCFFGIHIFVPSWEMHYKLCEQN